MGALDVAAAEIIERVRNMLVEINGLPPTNAGVFWVEANGANVAANTNLNGGIRSSGGTPGSPSPYGYFQVQIYSSVAGTLLINDGSYSQGTATVSSTAIAAGSYYTIKVPAFGAAFQAIFTNGSTAGYINMSSGYTAT